MTPLEAAREAAFACDARTLGKFALLESTPNDVKSYCIEHFNSLGGCNRSVTLNCCKQWIQDAYKAGRGLFNAAWWRRNPWTVEVRGRWRWGPRIYFRELGQLGHFFFQPGLALAEFQLGFPTSVGLNDLDRIQQALGVLANTAPTPFWKAQVYAASAVCLTTAHERYVELFDRAEARPRKPGQDDHSIRRDVEKERERLEKSRVMPGPDRWSKAGRGRNHRNESFDVVGEYFYMP